MISQNDEISSTEKLLDTIRNKDTSIEDKIPAISPVPASGHPNTEAVKSFFAKMLPSKESITIGIEIGYNEVCLVKIKQLPEQKWRLMDFRSVPFNPGMSKESDEFADLLKTSLSEFCGPLKEVNIWCTISTARVDVKHFLIPNVPKKQIENSVLWKAKKEFRFDEKESIFDYRVQEEVIEEGASKLSIIAYIAPKNEVKEIKDLFAKTGFPLAGISIAPFAIRNLFLTGWIITSEDTIANLHIGHEWSRVDIYSKGNLILTRSIKSGVNGMIESLMNGYNKRIKTMSMTETAGEEEDAGDGRMDMKQAEKVLLSLRPDLSPLTEKDIGYKLKKGEIFELIQPAVSRFAKQVERTFDHYISTSGNRSVGKVYNSGRVHFYGSLIDYIGEKLSAKMEISDPLNPDKNPYLGDLTLPELVSSRAIYSLAVGMALSDNTRTPNFIVTYKDKKRKYTTTLISRSIFITAMLVLSIVVGYFLWVLNSGQEKQEETVRLNQQLDQLGGRVSKDIILQMAAKIKNKQQRLKDYSERFQAMAVINEIASITPSNIKLLSINADLGGVTGGKGEKSGKSLLLDGIIIGERQAIEASLVGYRMRLEDSPIFSAPKVFKRALKPCDEEGDVLRFTIELKLI